MNVKKIYCNYIRTCGYEKAVDCTRTCGWEEADKCPHSVNENKFKYYNSGTVLGIVGTIPAHESGDYTFIPSLTSGRTSPWIKTCDLHNTREEAEKSSPAKFI